MIIDPSLIIDFLRGKSPAVTFLGGLQSTGDTATHPVVIAETLQGARNRTEQVAIEALFNRFQIVEVEPSDLSDSIVRLKQFSLSHGVGWHDCLIAATAHRLGLSVATLNQRDFACFGDVNVVRPY